MIVLFYNEFKIGVLIELKNIIKKWLLLFIQLKKIWRITDLSLSFSSQFDTTDCKIQVLQIICNQNICG